MAEEDGKTVIRIGEVKRSIYIVRSRQQLSFLFFKITQEIEATQFLIGFLGFHENPFDIENRISQEGMSQKFGFTRDNNNHSEEIISKKVQYRNRNFNKNLKYSSNPSRYLQITTGTLFFPKTKPELQRRQHNHLVQSINQCLENPDN